MDQDEIAMNAFLKQARILSDQRLYSPERVEILLDGAVNYGAFWQDLCHIDKGYAVNMIMKEKNCNSDTAREMVEEFLVRNCLD